MKTINKLTIFILTVLLVMTPSLSSFAEESKAAVVTDGENEYIFDSAGEAFKKANELGSGKKGVVMTLLADWTDEDDYLRNNPATLSGKTEITIDMNGFDIDRGIRGFKDYGSVFYVEKGSISESPIIPETARAEQSQAEPTPTRAVPSTLTENRSFI